MGRFLICKRLQLSDWHTVFVSRQPGISDVLSPAKAALILESQAKDPNSVLLQVTIQKYTSDECPGLM